MLPEVPFKFPVVLIGRTDGIPHLQENRRVGSHRRSGQTDSGILPLPVGMRHVKILVGKVISAGIGNLPVNHRDLPVIPVVHEHAKARKDRIEDSCPDPVCLHLRAKASVDKADASNIVIEQTDLHALLHLLRKDRMDSCKGLLVLDGKVLHENKLLRAGEIRKLRLKCLCRIGIIPAAVISVQRKTPLAPEIVCNSCRLRILLLQGRLHAVFLLQKSS